MVSGVSVQDPHRPLATPAVGVTTSSFASRLLSSCRTCRNVVLFPTGTVSCPLPRSTTETWHLLPSVRVESFL